MFNPASKNICAHILLKQAQSPHFFAMNQSPSFLAHINGLRALAILAILVYHLNASYCTSGYFGVDVFLVLSGYLLFRGLLKPEAAEKFHYGQFLLRKAWRIIPSWFVVTVVVCLCFSWLSFDGRCYYMLRTARASALFHADYYIDQSGNYFNTFTQQNPFLHYWYLSITEQLYIVAPLLVIPLARWCSRRAAVVLLVVLGGLSLAYYVLVNSTMILPPEGRAALLHAIGAKTAYYHLVPRLWEVLAGAGVLLLPEFASRARCRAVLAAVGFVGLLVSFFIFSTGSPSVYMTVVSAMLCLRYASSGPVAWLLGSAPVQFLGTISFSLYLWHWPIMVAWKFCTLEDPGLYGEVGMIFSSLLVGAFFWWLVERRKMPSLAGWKGMLLRCSLLLTIPVIIIGANKVNKVLRKSIAEATVPRFANACSVVEEVDANVLRGWEHILQSGMKAQAVRMGAPEVEPEFMLMGDSHALVLNEAFHGLCSKMGTRGLYLGASVAPICHLLRDPALSDNACWSARIADGLLAYLKEHPEIRCVVIAMYWESRLSMTSIVDERDGSVLHGKKTCADFMSSGLGEWCDRVRALGRQVVILGDTPTFREPSPWDEWERRKKLGLPMRVRVQTQQEHDEIQRFSHELHRGLAASGRAHYIDLAPAMCFNGEYPAMWDGEFLYLDTNHLSRESAVRVVEYLMPQLQKIMSSQSSDK